MKSKQRAVPTGLVALVAAVTLTAVAAAGPDAAKKQRVAMVTHAAKPKDVAPFVLLPLQSGPLERDSGQEKCSQSFRDVIRDGQQVYIGSGVCTSKGKRGSLTTRFRIEWIEAGNGYNVGTGSWKVIRGTGVYLGITGGGRSGHVGLNRGPWSGRAEGFLILP